MVRAAWDASRVALGAVLLLEVGSVAITRPPPTLISSLYGARLDDSGTSPDAFTPTIAEVSYPRDAGAIGEATSHPSYAKNGLILRWAVVGELI
jgi:hypothetical protein